MNQNLLATLEEGTIPIKIPITLETGLKFMKQNFVYLTLPLEKNTDKGATTLGRNQETGLGSRPRRQVRNENTEMKHCSSPFIVNAFSCVRLCVVLVCPLLGNILWSFDSAFPTIRWLFNTSVENSLACRRACASLRVHVDSTRTHMLLVSERSGSQRCPC